MQHWRTARIGLAMVVAAGTLGLLAGSPASASASAPADNPYAPNYQHAYRHGAVPTVGRLGQMRAYGATHAANGPAFDPSADLHFGGGVDGIGVTTGHEQVYLVFWGNQWGFKGTDPTGNLTFSNDPGNAAPRLQEMFKGLGTGGELWSGVMTQYCDEEVLGAIGCLSTKPRVGYPTGGALAGVWFDTATEPSTATPAELGAEAVRAAGQFGNTNASLNRNAQYVILSAPGLNPDDYRGGGFCAWHNWNGDAAVNVPSSVGDVAFTNMPYVLDAGGDCGMNFVNSGAAGKLDGYTIVEGHEYAETITDQNPAGGWFDSSGEENADKCAWISPSVHGGAANVAMANGSFALPGTWSNDSNNGEGGCEISHPLRALEIVSSVSDLSTKIGQSRSVQLLAAGGTAPYSWSVSGLPPGVSATPDGLISGAPNALGSYSLTYTVRDAAGASLTGSFTWTVTDIETRVFVGNATASKPGPALSQARQRARTSATAAGFSLANCDEDAPPAERNESGGYDATVTLTCTR